jgi:inner membrane protein
VDNITHTLTGLILVRAGVGRSTRGATAAMLLASNAPDLDIVSAITGGAVPYLAAHRGPTHGPLGVVGLALVSALIVWTILKWRSRVEDVTVSLLGRLIGVALVGSTLHVLMDLPTSYGVRLFSPFSTTWYALDWLPIVDLYLLGILVAGVAAGSMNRARLVTIARVTLVAMAVFYGFRATAQRQALTLAATYSADGSLSECAAAPVLSTHPAVIEARVAGPGACLQAAALPTFLSPLRWQLIRQQTDGYELRQISLLAPYAVRFKLWIPSESDEWVAAARRTRTARVFLNFSRLPATRSVTERDGSHQVRLVDVRFIGGPFQWEEEPQMRPPFIATVVIAPSGAVLREGLGP